MTSSAVESSGWPWGKNDPTRRRRVILALGIALASTGLLYAAHPARTGRATDFDMIWFSAKAMIQGRDPYPIVGPGLEFNHEYRLLWPATSFVVALPLAALSKQAASLVMVAVSTFLLAFGLTNGSWHRLPLFASAAFFDSVLSAQWTIVFTAALFLPWLAALAAAKPQTSLPVLAGSSSRQAIIAASMGGLFLVAVSLYFLPGWPQAWIANIRTAGHIRSPLFHPIGAISVLALVRWKRAEAWLVFVAACAPQTFMWYSALVLLSIPKTYREAIFLSLVSSVGFCLAAVVATYASGNPYGLTWSIYLATTFVPAVVVVLIHPNDGNPPAWLGAFLKKRAVPSADVRSA